MELRGPQRALIRFHRALLCAKSKHQTTQKDRSKLCSAGEGEASIAIKFPTVATVVIHW